MKMKNSDGSWTDEAKQVIWEKAPLLMPGNSTLRIDPCGAIMRWEDYDNKDSDFGWHIDHAVPESLLEEKGVPRELIDNIDNLRPMQWLNNISKDNSFPVYQSKYECVGKINLPINKNHIINKNLYARLSLLYGIETNSGPNHVLHDWLKNAVAKNGRFPNGNDFFDPEVK